MSEPIKSVLLVDYDSLHGSLTGAGGEVAAHLAPGVSGWLAAIESGRLLGAEGARRAISLKRCYASPALLGKGSDQFTAADFDMVDCGESNGRADLAMTIDAMEALADPAGYQEFIVLSAEPALAPLLARLKAWERKIVIFADPATPESYRALADTTVEVATLAEQLTTHGATGGPAGGPERGEVEAFARKVHAATNIPLFSPKTFAELFRYLTEEIATSGYHFQTTAKNVADRLAESGRSVTRRQVVFIVKGLALKGHVFSANDTPRRLAESYREQALYLINSAGLRLDEQQERLLSAWLVDRVPAVPPATPKPVAAEAPQDQPKTPAATEAKPPEVKATEAEPPAEEASTAAEAPADDVTKAAAPAEDEAATAQPAEDQPEAVPAPAEPPARKSAAAQAEVAAKEKPAAAPAAEKPAEAAAADERPPAASAAEEKPAETKPDSPPPAADKEPEPQEKQPPEAQTPPAEAKPGKMISPDDAKAAIAARVAAAVRIKPGSSLVTPAAKVSPKRRSAEPPPETEPEPAAAREPESIESSILAAIAEAVDVLVEDGGDADEATPPEPARKKRQQPSQPRPKPKAAPLEPDDDGDNIGNEIQRIIATYNRTRKDEGRK